MARSYEVMSAIRYQRRRWAEGATVEMEEALAKDLVARGRLRPKATKDQAPGGEKDASKTPGAKAPATKVPTSKASASKAAPPKTSAPKAPVPKDPAPKAEASKSAAPADKD